MPISNYAIDMENFILMPMLRILRSQGNEPQCLVVPFENLFRQMECWKYTATCDKGYSDREHYDVYASLDLTFMRVFDDHGGVPRRSAGRYMSAFIRLAYQEIVEGKPSKRKNLRSQLVRFLEKLDQHFRQTGQFSLS